MSPALAARRWVIVGDVRQLPPFSDRAMLEAHARTARGAGLADDQITVVEDGQTVVLAGLGRFADSAGHAETTELDDDERYRVHDALQHRDPNAASWGYTAGFAARSGARGRLVIHYPQRPERMAVGLLDVLAGHVAAAFDNIHLNREVLLTQHEMILTLGEVVGW